MIQQHRFKHANLEKRCRDAEMPLLKLFGGMTRLKSNSALKCLCKFPYASSMVT